MAHSHMGRLLNERAEREIAKMGLELLDGVCHDIQTYHYYLGRAAAIKWFLQQIDEIEGPNE